MCYLSDGLAEMGRPSSGRSSQCCSAFSVSAVLSAGMPSSQPVDESGSTVVPMFNDMPWLFGLIITSVVGVVIIGGIQRIAQVAERIVPAMCGIYVLACLYILVTHAGEIPGARGDCGRRIQPGCHRRWLHPCLGHRCEARCVSNEAADRRQRPRCREVKHPVEEGVVALLEPFIDTGVVCTMTALVIIITGAWSSPDAAYVAAREAGQGGTLDLARHEQRYPDLQVHPLSGGLPLRFLHDDLVVVLRERCWRGCLETTARLCIDCCSCSSLSWARS